MTALTELKRELALGYRVMGEAGLGLGILAHLTARAPDGEAFWTYQLGQSVEEVRIEDLAESDFGAQPVDSATKINPSLALHGDIYRARPDVNCILHHHGDYAVALGCIGENLAPFDRNAARWHGLIALAADFEAPAIHDQGDSVVATLGQAGRAALLKHHGVLIVASSVREAVVGAIDLEASCGVQLKAMAAGKPQMMPAAEIADCKKFLCSDEYVQLTWAYRLRRLARQGLDDIGRQ